ncbi:MAG: peptidoglycan DD-metalloendopeptidase family protein [Pseudomonadota bacterium]
MRLEDQFESSDSYALLEDEQPRKPSALKRWLQHAFRERQIYLRSDGEVQFITLRPWLQIACTIVFAVGLFWLAYATVNIAFKDQLIALKERKSQYVRITYEDRLSAMRSAMDGLNGRLLIDQDQYLRKVDELKAELDAINERQARIESFFKQGWMPARVVNPPDPSIAPSEPPVEENSGEAQDSLEEAIPSSDGKGDLQLPDQSSLDPATPLPKNTSNVPDVFRKKFARPFATHEQAREPLSELSNMFAEMHKRQMDLLDEIDQFKDRRIQIASLALKRAGLNPKRVARNSRPKTDFIGGPFIKSKDPAFKKDALNKKLVKISRKITAYEKLTHAMKQMPLAYPIRGGFRVTSGFGVRRDPFRRTRAMHAGIDFKAKYGHPIRVTASGTVLRAGRLGAYGKMVEVRHSHGITTRYAHLSRISVRPGQRVRRGQVVGKLGNTGRSTGAHLHYETRVYKRAINPRRFWKMRSVAQQ